MALHFPPIGHPLIFIPVLLSPAGLPETPPPPPPPKAAPKKTRPRRLSLRRTLRGIERGTIPFSSIQSKEWKPKKYLKLCQAAVRLDPRNILHVDPNRLSKKGDENKKLYLALLDQALTEDRRLIVEIKPDLIGKEAYAVRVARACQIICSDIFPSLDHSQFERSFYLNLANKVIREGMPITALDATRLGAQVYYNLVLLDFAQRDNGSGGYAAAYRNEGFRRDLLTVDQYDLVTRMAVLNDGTDHLDKTDRAKLGDARYRDLVLEMVIARQEGMRHIDPRWFLPIAYRRFARSILLHNSEELDAVLKARPDALSDPEKEFFRRNRASRRERPDPPARTSLEGEFRYDELGRITEWQARSR